MAAKGKIYGIFWAFLVLKWSTGYAQQRGKLVSPRKSEKKPILTNFPAFPSLPLLLCLLRLSDHRHPYILLLFQGNTPIEYLNMVRSQFPVDSAISCLITFTAALVCERFFATWKLSTFEKSPAPYGQVLGTVAVCFSPFFKFFLFPAGCRPSFWSILEYKTRFHNPGALL